MSRYNLEDIIAAVKAGEISETQGVELLERSAKYQESSQNSKENRLKAKMGFIDANVASNRDNPEEILLERERLAELVDLWAAVEEVLTPRQLEIFMMFIECQENCAEVGRELGVTQQAVFKTIQGIRKKIQKHLGDMLNEYREVLLPPQSLKEATKPMGVGYIFEKEMKMPVESSWQTKYGRKIFYTKEICHMPEYLANTNSYSICTICEEKCTRKIEFPMQPRLSEEKEKIIKAIIARNRVA